MSTGKGIFVIYDQIIIYDISENKEVFFLFDARILFSQFQFCLLCCVPVKSHSAAWVHTVPQRSGPVISQLPYLRPKFTVQGLYAPAVLPLWVSPSPAVPDTHSKHPGPRKADIFTKLC